MIGTGVSNRQGRMNGWRTMVTNDPSLRQARHPATASPLIEINVFGRNGLFIFAGFIKGIGTMIRLTTALLTLGVGMAIATTAIAQPGWWVGCNPEADLCRLLSGGADPRLAPRYVAPTYPMYIYVPRHSTRTHRTRTHSRY